MSNSSPAPDSGRFSGQKMNFSATCSLLSQYIKDNRSVSLSSPAAADGCGDNRATMNLFPMTGGKGSDRCVGHSVNLFPHLSGFNSSAASIASVGKRGSSEPASGQMTIFYGGQVMVFSDLPTDKAKEVMDLASNFESSLKKRKVEPPTTSSPYANANVNPDVTPNLNVTTNFTSPVIPVTPQFRVAVANASDLPIARKASLHRFLEKRKDRLVGKIPTSADFLNGGSPKPADGKSWLGLGSCPVYQPLQQL